METLLSILVGVLRLVPLILVFFIPCLFGMVTLRERGESYRVKAGLWFGLGLLSVVSVELLFRSVSAAQVASTLGISVFQFVIALALAALTAYKLAD